MKSKKISAENTQMFPSYMYFLVMFLLCKFFPLLLLRHGQGSPICICKSAQARASAFGTSGGAIANEQDYSNFSLSVPSGATINGIEVKVEGLRVQSNQDLGIRLSWNGGSTYTATTTQTINTSSDATYTYGGATSTWGRSWTDSELSNANFKLYAADTTNTNRWVEIDHIQVKVYYTEATTGTPGVTYIHPDHLGGTNVTSNEDGYVSQVLDYYPFGGERIATGGNNTSRHYIGERYDSESGLNYLNNRYLNSARGQFLSQDPVFWEIGQTQDGKVALMSPQLQNSYSYAGNNPIVNEDPNGRIALPALLAAYGLVSYYALLQQVRLAKDASPDGKLNTTQNVSYGIQASLSIVPGLSRQVGILKNDVAQAKLEMALSAGGAVLSNLQVPDWLFEEGSIYQTTPSTNSSGLAPSDDFSTYFKLKDNSWYALSNNSNAQVVSRNFSSLSSSQSNAVQRLGGSFGVSKFTSAQVKAINNLKSAFSKKR